jgi:hypothetical protein
MYGTNEFMDEERADKQRPIITRNHSLLGR